MIQSYYRENVYNYVAANNKLCTKITLFFSLKGALIMDDKNKKVVSEDKSLNLDDLGVVAGGGGMQEDAETNPTTSISTDTMEKI